MTRTPLTAHFNLEEFVPHNTNPADVPSDVRAAIETLVNEIMEPLRQAIVVPIAVHDGWRPPAYNASVGGKSKSDHLTGNAADWNAAASEQRSWEENTIMAFHWIRTQLVGHFGQLILEDHRAHTGKSSSLWVHVANVTDRHPGTEADKNRVLLSWNPITYEPYTPERCPTQ
jgi:hypothetical protein